MSDRRRYAVVTPYHGEDRALIERCVLSVQRQTVSADHLVIADGMPQPWLDDQPVRHIRLDRPHGDYGNTPRGVGAVLAVSEDYDGIGFLDADNWLDPRHVELCIASAQAGLPDYVIAHRHFRRPDGTIIPIDDQDARDHVDTNCLFLLRPSYFIVSHFALVPKELAPIGDRIFYGAVKAAGLKPSIVLVKTVNYHCLWEAPYRDVGEAPPPGAKPNVDSRPIKEWVRALSPRDLRRVSRLCGVDVENLVLGAGSGMRPPPPKPPSRNLPCPCGSGRKYKHCHGKENTSQLGAPSSMR
jgi:hypothetical protein